MPPGRRPVGGDGSTLPPAYLTALQQLAKKRLIGDAPSNNGRAVGDAPLDELPQIGNAPPGKRSVIGGTGKGGLGIVGDALNMAKGIVLSPVATVADIAWKPFEAIPGAPDFNPEDAGTVNLFVQGGKSLQHVYGDAKELGRSIITGKDTLSQSPTAKTYQAAGGGLEGALMAAAPYLDVGSVVAPMALGAARGAGLVAPKPVPYTPLTVGQVDATRPMTPYRTTRNALAEDMAQAMTADELRNFAEKVAGSTQQVANLDNGLYGVWGDDPLINDRLRGDYLGTDVDEQIKLAQEFFTRVPPLQRPVKAFRGIMVERPEAGTNAFSDFVRTWEVGDVIEEPGFMSTTIDRNIAEGYANGGRVIEIDIPKGTQVATPEMFGPALRSTEQELTLPPGTKLQITSIADDVIKAKVVPSDTPITKMQTTRDALLRYVDPEVTAPQAGRTMNPVEELASAKARAETAPVVRDIAAEGTIMNDPYVFNVGGERIVFGPPELDISSVKAGPDGVRVVPIDPYELSNLKMGTEAGDKIADDFTIAMGVDREMAPALLYAGSRGNKSAMAQFEQLVETGRAEMKQRRAMVNSKPEIPDEVWASTAPEVMVDTGRTVRPANIDDLFLVHETAYAPPTNQAGDVVLSPSSEFGPYGRDTVHFSLNHVVSQNEGRIFSGDNRYIVIVPLRDALDANPGSLDNLLWGDTFLTPKPGRGLTLPRRSVKVLTNPDADQVSKTLSQVAAAHNKSSGYKVLTAEEVGGHTSKGLSVRISYLADRVIPNEYDEYVSEIGSARHVAHPMWNKQASFESVSTVAPVPQVLLSPNSRMQYFRGLRRFLGHEIDQGRDWG